SAWPDYLVHLPKLPLSYLPTDPPVQFSEAGLDALDMQDMDLVSGIVDDAGQFLVGELLAAEPLPRPSHRVVEEAVVGNRWPLGVDDREAVARRRHDPLRASEHLQVDHFHEHRSMASSTAIGPSDRVSGLTS